MIHYCTYFDRNYVTRALALHRSLVRHSPPFTLWALCFDDDAFAAISALGLESFRAISLADFERYEPELVATKSTRSTIEYYFTATPCLPLFVLNQVPDAGAVTYLDADLLFYSTPQPIFDELAEASVLIVPHRFPARLRSREVYGVYNVGLLTFRNDPAGRAVLSQWRTQCLEWCYDRVEDGRFADQRYLDEWPDQPRVVVSRHVGVGLAPWNFMQYRIDVSANPPTVDGKPLVFYHFQGFKAVGPGLFDLGLEDYAPMDRRVRGRLYGGYVRELRDAAAILRAAAPDFASPPASIRLDRYSLRRLVRRVIQREVMISLGP
jgi:hypothetical protein